MQKIYSDRRFMFFYLNTGNGHIAQARVLKDAMLEYDPSIQVKLQNGFSEKEHISHKLLEKLYGFSCNYLHGAWPIIYGLGHYHFFQKLIRYSVTFQNLGQLKKLIRKNKITDIVSFHFMLSPSICDAIKSLDKNIRLTVIATDPFTGPEAWFFNRNLDYIVFSEEFRNFGINLGVKPENIRVMPFLLNKKYRTVVSETEKIALRKKYGFDERKKLVLLAGGGEGLPGTLKIINQCIIHKADFAVAVVCGRNKALQKSLKIYAKAHRLDLHIFGFVDFMDSLIKMSDLVVSKAGTSTLLEIISLRKPVIINTYIHGQELGNMRFIVRNGAGFFIRHSADIFRKINEIFSSEESYNFCINKTRGLSIDTDVAKIVKYLLEK